MRPPRFTRQQLRRTAGVALFAWLFALSSGVANACLAAAARPGTAAFAAAAGASVRACDAGVATCAHDAGPASHHADGAPGEPASAGGQAVCLKFCADESSALAKSKTAAADLAGPVLLSGAQWPPVLPVAAAAPWQPAERPACVGPPLFLRLLRLTT